MTERSTFLRRIEAQFSAWVPSKPKPTLPSRSLTSQVKPLRYIPASNTDVTRTWRKFRLLLRIQAHDTSGPARK